MVNAVKFKGLPGAAPKTSKCDKVTSDTVFLTVLSMILQALGILFNAKLSEKAGAAAVGIMSLIFSFFSCIMVLANGNIFVSTSRFISEEHHCGGNTARVMRYSLTFCLILSGSFAAATFFGADIISEKILRSAELGTAVKILSFSLMPAAAGACIKGYFHGLRKINVPMAGETSEFIFKWICMGIMLIFFPKVNFIIVTAASVCVGEIFSCVWYIHKFAAAIKCGSRGKCPAVLTSGRQYMKLNAPMVFGGYVKMIMSAANEAVVPAMLLKYSMSSEIALSEYGMFESMIIPAVFFPSAAMESMSNIMIPESAAAAKEGGSRPAELTESTFRKAFRYSIFIAALFLLFGNDIGRLISPTEPLVGRSLTILAPVIPFIYLEIILEGMLKGMGEQNFCTVNSLIEYIIRIACVLIFVPLIGFDGVLVSYYVSNCTSNIARIIKVCRKTGAAFRLAENILYPVGAAVLCCAAGVLAGFILPERESTAALAVELGAAVGSYLLLEVRK